MSAISYQAGLAAEDIVARAYCARGFVVNAHRWRGAYGEIDLILSDKDHTVFVEVKKSRDFARAATRITARQLRRIEHSASDYLSRLPTGQASTARIDVALVNGTGQVEILENVTMH